MDRNKKIGIIAAAIIILFLILAECQAESLHRDAKETGDTTASETTAPDANGNDNTSDQASTGDVTGETDASSGEAAPETSAGE